MRRAFSIGEAKERVIPALDPRRIRGFHRLIELRLERPADA
jgi:hypothetical protein